MRPPIALFILLGLLLAGCITCHGQNNAARPNIPLNSASLPLDSFTNNWSAYSVARKLRTAYSGDAFMLLNSGGASNNIGFVGNIVDTNAITTFAAGGVCYLAVLYDQGGVGRHMSMSPAWGQGIDITNSLAMTDASGALFLDSDGHVRARTNPLGFCSVCCMTSTNLPATNVTKFLVWDAFQHDVNYALFTGASLESGTIKQTTVMSAQKVMSYANGSSLVDSDTYSLNTQYLVQTFSGDFVSTGDTIQLNDGTIYTADLDHNGGGRPCVGYDGGLTRTAGYYFSELYLWIEVMTGGQQTTLRDNINAFYTLW